VIAGGGFAIIIIGLIAFTNFTASRMEKASAARSAAQSTAVSTANPAIASETDLTPKSKLESMRTDTNASDSADTTASLRNGGAVPATGSSCNSAARQRIVATFTGLLSAEDSEHKHNLSTILSNFEKTGLFTQILNPGMLSSRISSENQRHQTALKSLTTKEVSELTAIHCNS
jgi:hypothetical protein